MKNNLLVLLLCSLILLTGCTQTAGNAVELKEENKRLTEELNEKEIKLKESTKSIEELNHQIDEFNMEKENFVFISNLSMDFVNAHTTADKETLRELLSEELVLEEKEEKLYVKVQGYDWVLFDYHNQGSFDDWVIQGYEFSSENKTYSVFIREFYSDVNGEPVSPPTFLNLVFELQENEWKIISLGFDV